MIVRARAWGGPMVFPLRGRDRQIVYRGVAAAHQPAFVELPVLVAVGAEPVAGIVTPLIGEAHRDPVAGEGPELLDQPVIELARPFAREESDDRGPPLEEFGAVAPPAILGIGEGDLLRIAAVPAILGRPHLSHGGLVREGWQRRTRFAGHVSLLATSAPPPRSNE